MVVDKGNVCHPQYATLGVAYWWHMPHWHIGYFALRLLKKQ